MKILASLVAALMFSGCYSGISGRVIDSDTQLPIEGAIVLAQWTKTKGIPGLTYREVHKTVETETDKNGTFSLSGVYSPFVDAPNLVICKQGYVTWRNDFIFPGYKKRTDYGVWKNSYIYKLDKFKDEYSIEEHSMFMNHGITDIYFNRFPKFANAQRNESIRASLERERLKNTLILFDFNGRVVDSNTGEPIEGAIVLALNAIGYGSKTTNVLEGISDSKGQVRVTGMYPMLYRFPSIIIYKKGYIAQHSNYGGGLFNFKWSNGYVFRLSKWNSSIPPKNHYEMVHYWAAAAEKAGKPLLMNSIQWEKHLE